MMAALPLLLALLVVLLSSSHAVHGAGRANIPLCPMYIWIYDNTDDCLAQTRPLIKGKLHVDGKCHTTEVIVDSDSTSSEASADAIELLPGTYTAQCVVNNEDAAAAVETDISSDMIEFMESGCLSDTCSSNETGSSIAGCDKMDIMTSPSSYYATHETPVYPVQPFNSTTKQCLIMKGLEGTAGTEIVFAIYGSCRGNSGGGTNNTTNTNSTTDDIVEECQIAAPQEEEGGEGDSDDTEDNNTEDVTGEGNEDANEEEDEDVPVDDTDAEDPASPAADDNEAPAAPSAPADTNEPPLTGRIQMELVEVPGPMPFSQLTEAYETATTAFLQDTIDLDGIQITETNLLNQMFVQSSSGADAVATPSQVVEEEEEFGTLQTTLRVLGSVDIEDVVNDGADFSKFVAQTINDNSDLYISYLKNAVILQPSDGADGETTTTEYFDTVEIVSAKDFWSSPPDDGTSPIEEEEVTDDEDEATQNPPPPVASDSSSATCSSICPEGYSTMLNRDRDLLMMNVGSSENNGGDGAGAGSSRSNAGDGTASQTCGALDDKMADIDADTDDNASTMCQSYQSIAQFPLMDIPAWCGCLSVDPPNICPNEAPTCDSFTTPDSDKEISIPGLQDMGSLTCGAVVEIVPYITQEWICGAITLAFNDVCCATTPNNNNIDDAGSGSDGSDASMTESPTTPAAPGDTEEVDGESGDVTGVDEFSSGLIAAARLTTMLMSTVLCSLLLALSY